MKGGRGRGGGFEGDVVKVWERMVLGGFDGA